MRRIGRARPRRPFAVLAALLVAMMAFGPVGTASADSYVKITGSGSTWSSIAIAAWVTDVANNGLAVDYQAVGSTAGRQNYIYGTSDFAVSEIPFQTEIHDGQSAEDPSNRPYAYLPIVAGGTSFMYHLTIAGQQVRDLRLSGETITKIFTGVITNWSDPEITADYGKQLPNEVIKPVVRSDGSGTSAQFSLYMSTQYPDLWNTFCQAYMGLTPPCGLTSQYPQFPGSTAQNGSNGVANYVAASYSEGAITYVEYAYALGLNYPVVKLLNNAGAYTSPTASNVAVSLTGATINADLTQNLNGVYNNSDPRTYQLSSYSYMIVPTTTAFPMTEGKGKSLSTFINYFLCGGQQKADELGYSPLPVNLVQSGFDQVRKIPGFVAPPTDLEACNNPTFQGGVNTLLDSAPFPPACDYVNAAPCAATTPTGDGNGDQTSGGTSGGTGGTGGGTAGGDSGGTAGGGGATTGTGGQAVTPGVDPETGLPVTGTGGTQSTTNPAVGQVQTLGALTDSSTQSRVMYGLTAVEIVLAILLPPLFASMLRRRRRGGAK